MDRYDGFRGPIHEPVSRGGTERLGGGGGGSRNNVSSLDDTDVAGVSFHSVSREALMKKLARRDEPKEEPAYVPCRPFD